MTLKERKIFLQVDMMYYLIKRWGISLNEFLDLDERYNILRLLRLGYEPFHLTGDEGIALEVEKHIKECGGRV